MHPCLHPRLGPCLQSYLAAAAATPAFATCNADMLQWARRRLAPLAAAAIATDPDYANFTSTATTIPTSKPPSAPCNNNLLTVP